MATQIIHQLASMTPTHIGETRRQKISSLFSTTSVVLRRYFGPGQLYYLKKDHQGALSAKEKSLIDACVFGIPLQ